MKTDFTVTIKAKGTLTETKFDGVASHADLISMLYVLTEEVSKEVHLKPILLLQMVIAYYKSMED